MSSKATKQLADFVTLIRGTTYKGALVGKPGPALLGLGSIQPGGGFRDADFKTYGGDCPQKLMLVPGDLFASLKGATKDGKMIGSVARVPNFVHSGRLTQDTVKLEFLVQDKAIQRYIYWLLRTPQYREYCAGRAMGSAVVALSREDFLSYPIPALTHYKTKLVDLLEVVEERVRLLRDTNTTLDCTVQALFKSWFVDFDPVLAKVKGLKPEGVSATAAALFPDSFEESELGLVPSGWIVRSLDSIANYLNGLALQKFPPTDDVWLPVIKIAQLRKGDTVGADRAGRNIKSEYIVQNGDVLFSWSGSLEVVIWSGGEGALNQHLFKVTSKDFPKWFYYLWTRQHLSDFQEIAASKATTMGHIQRKHLTEAKVVVPTAEMLRIAGELIEPLIERWLLNAEIAQNLTQLRDSLLPSLISGKLRLPETEASLENMLSEAI
ncbi:Type I restriction modification DNA specificity domain protein [Pseudomonas fluorescens]|uniref:restriction endonuclease subunit S n=1 Tax=Pseudomonas TaxID=286 RepID=UPI00076D0A24|nr:MULTISPECIES: restriction endonuclease subunit S [Pseudomonas]KWV80286.1 Type I restriction modification DNA specificity domain protein [Pseudomonas fluorescens]NNA26719.1 restriction endonuclease subunit S [Pseudomonas lundensis]NNB26321.1 restriction endonuclease subunit S [Pseudomonas fragi]HCS08768.1 restriction endonuclease subunit S [Pseudomonas sp.]